MKRAASALVLVAVIAAAGTGGYWVGQHGLPPVVVALLPEIAKAETAGKTSVQGPVIYYRHPDDLPEYSANPANTPDGRAFRPVLASEDVSFDDAKPERLPEKPGGRKLWLNKSVCLQGILSPGADSSNIWNGPRRG